MFGLFLGKQVPVFYGFGLVLFSTLLVAPVFVMIRFRWQGPYCYLGVYSEAALK